ncbi:hypothetical protein GCM10022225_04390 [Plantactinospora mayteni]|uniref:Uncharacterized protein n=1 Tax=Plantactinospora mayteni TaxID=566021 RepID=A0ABQ4EQJ8_9ACTN|nr:hypothetical protein Pma05_35010 [Plantactinospora mayteni]
MWARSSLPEEFRQEPLSLFVLLGSALYEAAGDLYRLCPNPGPDPIELHGRFLGWVRTDRMIRRALARRIAGLPAPPAAPSPLAAPALRRVPFVPPSARHYPDWRVAAGGP